MSPFARETLDDIRGHFGGYATFKELCEWYGASDAVMRDAIKQLLAAGKLWQVDRKLTTNRPRLGRARSLLARGCSLDFAAKAIGMRADELDLALWRDLHNRALAKQNVRRAA